MNVQYVISSPQGDVSVGPDLLEAPFQITPTQHHASLRLGDYFHALEDFLFNPQGRERLRRATDPLEIDVDVPGSNAVIHSEKHGALYHIARVELEAGHQHIHLAVSTAVTDMERHWLCREFRTLQHLNQRFHLPYLPRVYGLGDVLVAADPDPVALSMVLAEWLEGYSEWHLTKDETEGTQGVSIWEPNRVQRLASDKEALQIFKQASKVLTLYYDTQTGCQIFPWHHAAGDFVVKSQPGTGVDVRLTTARKYESITRMLGRDRVEPFTALIYFFLHLTLRMRLDKQDGVGEALWAEPFSLEGVMEGFLEALFLMEQEGRYSLGAVGEMIRLMRSFTGEEMKTLLIPLLALYDDADPADRHLIHAHLNDHAVQLHRIIRRYP